MENNINSNKKNPVLNQEIVQPRLLKEYHKEISPLLIKEHGYVNIHQVPRLVKVVLNMGLGRKMQDKGFMDMALEGLSYIAGQKPVLTKAKQSIAGFKLREGMPLGYKVTLRGRRMYEFIDRLVNIAMPRTRDFRGLSHKSFDGNGNFAFGIKEHHIFPEIEYSKISDILGFDVVICTTAKTNKEALALLKAFNFPFHN